ncbi:MAG TPA: Nif3-like dinuclear metal center hexameric protein [Bacteroidia bacterium]|jgi:dinuclear metal center YbgI/SA1388 family protein
MLRIKDITSYLESIAPLSLQESYDNAGLIVGDPFAKVTGALICLDSTEEVIAEAIKNKCNLVIAHHPIIFGGLKKLNGKNYVERTVMMAIKNDIAIYAAHTNLDNVSQGVNAMICSKLGLTDTQILSPKTGLLRKLVTFCPVDKAGKVRQALFAAGAGQIGNYDECSFNAEGFGTFRGSDDTNPYVGERGKQHRENELKIETIFPQYLEPAVIKALLNSHPYEEVAYDIVPLGNVHPRVGSGMVGEFKKEMDEKTFLKSVKSKMECGVVRHTAFTGKKIKRVAVCGGAGSFLLKAAIGAGADAYVSADFKYHEFFDAEGKILVSDIGHFESEQFTKDLFYSFLTDKFPNFAVRLTKINTNPINYF